MVCGARPERREQEQDERHTRRSKRDYDWLNRRGAETVDRAEGIGTDTLEPGAPRPSPLAGLRERTHVIIGDLRQWQYPPELRIGRALPKLPVASRGPDQIPAPDAETKDSASLDRSIAKVAVCLWDIRRKLEGNSAAQQDRKLRMLNRRAESAVLALQDIGVVIDDPIGRRYVLGSEGSMKSNLLPTEGATSDEIVETVSPIVYRDDRLIGRGEVFVAVPAPSQGPGEYIGGPDDSQPPTEGVTGPATATGGESASTDDNDSATLEPAVHRAEQIPKTAALNPSEQTRSLGE
jgi:hypothetical protein